MPAGRWMTRLFSYSDPVCTQINTQTGWNSSQCTLPRAELHSNDTLHLDVNAAATLYLEDVRFEDVMSQFHSLLPIQLPLLAGEHESHESVSSPEVETKAERLLLCHRESTWVPSDESAVSFSPTPWHSGINCRCLCRTSLKVHAWLQITLICLKNVSLLRAQGRKHTPTVLQPLLSACAFAVPDRHSFFSPFF